MDIKQKNKVILAINKLLVESNNKPSYEEIKEEVCCVMTPDNVAMIIAKTEIAKEILRDFIDKDRNNKIPELDYNENDREFKSNYNISYVSKFIKVIEIYQDKATFKIKKDFPMTIESTHFNFILAPRIDE